MTATASHDDGQQRTPLREQHGEQHGDREPRSLQVEGDRWRVVERELHRQPVAAPDRGQRGERRVRAARACAGIGASCRREERFDRCARRRRAGRDGACARHRATISRRAPGTCASRSPDAGRSPAIASRGLCAGSSHRRMCDCARRDPQRRRRDRAARGAWTSSIRYTVGNGSLCRGSEFSCARPSGSDVGPVRREEQRLVARQPRIVLLQPIGHGVEVRDTA